MMCLVEHASMLLWHGDGGEELGAGEMPPVGYHCCIKKGYHGNFVFSLTEVLIAKS